MPTWVHLNPKMHVGCYDLTSSGGIEHYTVSICIILLLCTILQLYIPFSVLLNAWVITLCHDSHLAIASYVGDQDKDL